MNGSWQFYNPVRIYFDTLSKLKEIVSADSVLLVTTPGSSRRGVSEKVINFLSGIEVEVYDRVTPNPSFQQLEAARNELPCSENMTVIGLGGGSAMDSAKAFSLLSHPQGKSFKLGDHLKTQTSLPAFQPLDLITIPTTSGTGGEVTPFATVWDEVAKKKYSLAGENLFAGTALLDPELTKTLPPEVTVSGGLDALSQCLESIWNKNATPITAGWAQEGIRLVLEFLPVALNKPNDLSVRSNLMHASLLSGLAISQTRTALAHSISYPLTARFGLPHGLACGFTLPEILRFNADAAPRSSHPFVLLPDRLGFAGHRQFADELEFWLGKIQINSWLDKYLPESVRLEDLSGEMYTPQRAGNNIRGVSEADIKRIITASL
jgi:alcohol dehydrogenase